MVGTICEIRETETDTRLEFLHVQIYGFKDGDTLLYRTVLDGCVITKAL